MKIRVIDSWNKHWNEGIEYWRRQGHEVNTGIYWGPELVEDSDVTLFHPVDNNLKQASIKQGKPPNTIIIAEAVDIDIYANHPGAVKWEYVDALVYMARHMMDYSEKRFKIPDSVSKHLIPGGVNLKHWTLRERERGHNVAWMGRYWIGKNYFGALQIFNELIKKNPTSPWRLFIRGEQYHPEWWEAHIESYLKANPELVERIEFVPFQKDLNTWLEDMDFLLQTSFKEAFGYVVAQCASKGIKPIIEMTTGALDIWPREWVFQTHGEAVNMFLDEYNPEDYRNFISTNYSIERRMESFDKIVEQHAS